MDRFKFRGKRVDNGELVYGSLVVNNVGQFHIVTCPSLVEGEIFQVHPESVEQCTGLKDSNGKLIYEGDIIEWEHKDNEYDIVWFIWSDERMGWWCNDVFGNEFNICELNFSCCEVIGNTNENPELQTSEPKFL